MDLLELVRNGNDMKTQVLPCLRLNWEVEEGNLEVYGCYPHSWLKVGPYRFWCFHLNFSVFRNLFKVMRSTKGFMNLASSVAKTIEISEL